MSLRKSDYFNADLVLWSLSVPVRDVVLVHEPDTLE